MSRVTEREILDSPEITRDARGAPDMTSVIDFLVRKYNAENRTSLTAAELKGTINWADRSIEVTARGPGSP